MTRFFAIVMFAAFNVGCVHLPSRTATNVDVLVIAPHPDDEVLLAGGVLERALKAGQRAAVIIVTNGDYTCDSDRDGYVREAESISALTALGLPEADVHFLGYPDGYLPQLSSTPLPPVERRNADGTCANGATTYANRGAGHKDEHSLRTGAPADYTADSLIGDLAALLERLRPVDVYLPHAIDSHPDHAMTYVYFRRALDRLAEAPRVHRGVIHAGRCWPSDCKSHYVPDAELPPLPAPLTGYEPNEVLPIDARRKLAIIERYPSQMGPVSTDDWLASFARRDEEFFTERYEKRHGHWVRPGSTDSPTDGAQFTRFTQPHGPLTLNTATEGAYLELSLFGPEGLVDQQVVPLGQ